MLSIEELRRLLSVGAYDLSRHALHRIVERNISADMIREVSENAEIIEDYPDDKYSPSCLLCGKTRDGKPLHIQTTRSGPDKVKIITIYQPDPKEWIDFKIRRGAK